MDKFVKKYNKLFLILLVTAAFLLSFIFFYKKPYPSIVNFGDVMFDRGVRNIIENKKRDPFEYIKRDVGLLKSYDFFIVNLEGPIVEIDRSLCQQKIYNFQFAKDTPDRLKSVGINMVNISNNHNFDCFRGGFESTKKYLTESRIEYIGERDLEKTYKIKNIDNKKIVFIGIDAVTAPFPVSLYYPIIKKLKSENDYVVADIHWGEEYNLGFTSEQKQIAHLLIDSGVDVIFGHHPHVVEPVEVYKKGVIFYSLGNFVFDQDFGDTTVGLGAGVEFQNNKNIFNLFPFNIKKFAPEFMKGSERGKFCEDYLKNIKHTGCSFELKL